MAEVKIKSKFFNMEDTVDVKDSEITSLVTPTATTVATSVAQSLIEADKNIISQISREEEEGIVTLTFPIGVCPIYIFEDNEGGTLYFDYFNAVLHNSSGDVVDDIELSASDRVSISFERSNYPSFTIMELIYLINQDQ